MLLFLKLFFVFFVFFVVQSFALARMSPRAE
jgi:hypothetical protein